VLAAGSYIFQKVQTPHGITIDQIQVAVGIQIAHRNRDVTSQDDLSGAMENGRRRFGLVPRRPVMHHIEAAACGAVDQFDLLITVHVVRGNGCTILTEQDGSATTLNRARLHKQGRALATEIAIDFQESAMVGDHQLQIAPTAPGDPNGRRTNPQVQRSQFTPDLRLQLESWLVRASDVSQPENASDGRTSAPEAIAVISRVSGTLVEADHLVLGKLVGVGPVAFQVVDSYEQVHKTIRVSVDGGYLDDFGALDSQVWFQVQRNAKAERWHLLRARVGKVNEVVIGETDQIEPTWATVGNRTKAAKPAELGDPNPGIVTRGRARVRRCDRMIEPYRPTWRASAA
jgi:hypothetical protein